MHNDFFLSCDWGTSSFRLRLVKINGLHVTAEEVNDNGIADTFNNWKEKKQHESERIAFYLSYLDQQIRKLEQQVGFSLNELPLLVSGMASSSIGMMELPYKSIPFKTDGSDLTIEIIESSRDLRNRIIIISGTRTHDDVLRGEETLLTGCTARDAERALYIFPGTHSKHIQVQDNMATAFKTYMTGEFFNLLSAKSILSNSVKRDLMPNDQDIVHSYFEKGVTSSLDSNILNTAFHVRTNQLFKKNTPEENYQYLSGLLIGSELQDLRKNPPDKIVLVCSDVLKRQYWHALTLFGFSKELSYVSADEALINGQFYILKFIEQKEVIR